MSFTVEQKSQLAKLMATENLRIEHQKIQTAKFDPTNRVLYLPIWQDMNGALYDLLCGHEVGHALYTPAEGWHDAASDTTKGANYKSFLNVIEDARIEKKVKRRYPGLKMSFQKAYADLMARDFFGIADRDINEMPFIDRLNIYSKSQYSFANINFTAFEETLIRKVQGVETWEDVLRVTNEIYDYSKDEQQSLKNFDDFSDEQSDENGDYGNDSDDYDWDDSEDSDGETDGKVKSPSSQESEEEEDADDSVESTNRYKNSEESHSDMFQPNCETDDSYRKKEISLIDEKCKPYLYLDLPKPVYESIITPAKRVQEQMTKHFAFGDGYDYFRGISLAEMNKYVQEFKSKNERYIGLLAKEFEMRKAAKAFSKSKISDTGDIDVSKLASYKFDDNIFRKVLLTPKGKNHGLMLLLDKSGSMSDNMAGSIEQILVLAMFCRKVNIPFVVYGFGDSFKSYCADKGINPSEASDNPEIKDAMKSFEQKENQIALSNVRLREYINSKMSNVEFSQALRNMIVLKKSFEGGRFISSSISRPVSEELSNTPLTQAIIACGPLMKDFRKKYNLDLTSLVIVHDGDSDYTNTYFEKVREVDPFSTKKIGDLVTKSFYVGSTNIVVRDPKIGFEYTIREEKDNSDPMLNLSLEWFKKYTDSKVFGFFLVNASGRGVVKNMITNRYVKKDGVSMIEEYKKLFGGLDSTSYYETVDSLVRKFRSEKFLASYPKGYDTFFFVVGGEELKTENEEIEVDGKVTAGKLKTAFLKFSKKKALNRVLVSQFIQGIAA